MRPDRRRLHTGRRGPGGRPEVLTPHAVFEILMLWGYYRTVSRITNGLDLPLEAWAARFSQYGPALDGA
ncbi:hypothetical protein [Streptomyces sp. NPDC002328]|uniref:hypothetical protein n=1 Tax=Streptomyces sp. NPDC002328 TaxID=3364642 RepID=UPI0036CA0382